MEKVRRCEWRGKRSMCQRLARSSGSVFASVNESPNNGKGYAILADTRAPSRKSGMKEGDGTRTHDPLESQSRRRERFGLLQESQYVCSSQHGDRETAHCLQLNYTLFVKFCFAFP